MTSSGDVCQDQRKTKTRMLQKTPSLPLLSEGIPYLQGFVYIFSSPFPDVLQIKSRYITILAFLPHSCIHTFSHSAHPFSSAACAVDPAPIIPTTAVHKLFPLLHSPSAFTARSFSSAVVLVKSCFTWNSWSCWTLHFLSNSSTYIRKLPPQRFFFSY